MQMFDPIACGNTADTVNGCQMMSYSHIKKHLNRNEHLNLNLEKSTTLTAACFSHQVKNLIYLTGYSSVYR